MEAIRWYNTLISSPLDDSFLRKIEEAAEITQDDVAYLRQLVYYHRYRLEPEVVAVLKIGCEALAIEMANNLIEGVDDYDSRNNHCATGGGCGDTITPNIVRQS